jgi:hypothetical protein
VAEAAHGLGHAGDLHRQRVVGLVERGQDESIVASYSAIRRRSILRSSV